MSNIQKHKNTIARLEQQHNPPKRYAHVVEIDEENGGYIIPDGLEPNPSGVLAIPPRLSEDEWTNNN